MLGRSVVLFLCCTVGLLMGCKEKSTHSNSPLEELKLGNQRFLTGSPIHPHETLERIRALKKGQHPIAVIVSCSDSRVPPELIFDQGLGDIFSVRTAGNVIGDYELGSIEYAVEHLGCQLILVLGHQDCGAVKAYLQDTTSHYRFDHIKHLVDYIAKKEEERELDHPTLAKAVEANMLHGVHLLSQSEPILKSALQKKQIAIVGALYDIETGKVEFSH